MKMRIVMSLIFLFVWGIVEKFIITASPIISGAVAGMQFNDSNSSYIASQYIMGWFGGQGLPTFLFLGVLVAIWWGPLKAIFTKPPTIIGMMLLPLLFSSPAFAYYATTDKTEAYTILPNQSAFWIPDVGANKETQAKLDSEAYLNENKLSVKRFVIPHQKLTNSGGFMGWDAYVPTGRLILVDRTPYSREWVDAEDRGTSKSKQGFPCQSTEGLNITVGVSIGTSVSEANAAKFLYHFGVMPPKGDPADPQVIFASVYSGRSLLSVMDDVGRKKVQTLICDQISTRSFDKANAEAAQIMALVKQQADAYFKEVGISLDFIGWADTFTFDHEVQVAINRRYVAMQDKAVAEMLQPYATTIQALASADALRSFGAKTDGKLPTTVVGLPPELGSLLGTFLTPMAPKK